MECTSQNFVDYLYENSEGFSIEYCPFVFGDATIIKYKGFEFMFRKEDDKFYGLWENGTRIL